MALQELCHSCNLLHHSVRVVVRNFCWEFQFLEGVFSLVLVTMELPN